MRHQIPVTRHLKKAFALMIFTALAVVLCLAGCAGAQGNAGGASSAKVEQKTYPLSFLKDLDGTPAESEMNLYFVNDGDIPYVALSEYLPFFGQLYENEKLETKALEFEIEQTGGVYMATRTNTACTMAIDPAADTIDFVNYNGFLQSPGDTTLVSLVTIGENGLDEYGLLADSGNSYNRAGLLAQFNLSKYDIDLVEANGECYLPLQTMQDILLSRNYMLTIFNGEKVFVYPYGAKGMNDQIYTVEPDEMSEEFAKFNANELMFLIDNFYGLKAEHGIDDIYLFAANTGLDFIKTDPKAFDSALETLTSRYFDDLHSGFLHGSCLSDVSEQDDDSENKAGTSSSDSSYIGDMYCAKRKQFHPTFTNPYVEEGPPTFDYTEVGDTAIITFDSFSVDKQDYYKDADLDNPKDTIELIAAAHKRITREGSPIKNVVVDLSCNGGGNADAAAFIISWLAGAKPVGMRDVFTGAQSVVSYLADVNLDGKIDEKDTLLKQTAAGDLKLFCMTSPNSFSCGNLVPAAFKDAFGITLIGQATGGGSCVVLPCTSASGAQFQISGPSQISSIKNGSFYNADTGIEVDVPICDLETMYDRQKLVDFIHELK